MRDTRPATVDAVQGNTSGRLPLSWFHHLNPKSTPATRLRYKRAFGKKPKKKVLYVQRTHWREEEEEAWCTRTCARVFDPAWSPPAGKQSELWSSGSLKGVQPFLKVRFLQVQREVRRAVEGSPSVSVRVPRHERVNALVQAGPRGTWQKATKLQ